MLLSCSSFQRVAPSSKIDSTVAQLEKARRPQRQPGFLVLAGRRGERQRLCLSQSKDREARDCPRGRRLSLGRRPSASSRRSASSGGKTLKGASVIVLFESKHSLGSMSRGYILHNDKVFIVSSAEQWTEARREHRRPVDAVRTSR